MAGVNTYSAVCYARGVVADFVDRLRCEFTPGCPHHAHLTLLPPRPLTMSAAAAAEELADLLTRFDSFEVGFSGVDLFEDTRVIKLTVNRGLNELRALHDVLSTGSFFHGEDHPYEPHVTIGHGLDRSVIGPGLTRAREEWAGLGQSTMRVDRVAFVQLQDDDTWLDLAEFPLGAAVPAAR